MKSICVIGAGYVGLVTGTCFADLGNDVVILDIDAAKVERLKNGLMPIYEPGLEELVRRNATSGRLSFTASYEEALAEAEFVFIAVDTPSGMEGEADLKSVRAAASAIAAVMDHPLIIVNKSTVPIGTGDWVADIINRHRHDGVDFWVVSNPEFLREGSAVHDFLNPDRVVLGSLNREAAEKVAQLYLPLRAPIIVTDLRTAEMIKYASNAFLASRISFINEIAAICERLGADVKEVAAGMGYDRRIGPAFLDAGLGFGGSCFPKDVRALAHMAAIHGCHPQLLRAVLEINADQRRSVVQKLRDLLGGLDERTVGLLGLAFKPNTDDMREAPALELVHLLQHEGARVRAYDPVAMDNARRVLPDIVCCPDAYAVAEGADALIVATEWNEFKHLDLARIRDAMRHPIFVDGRNIYDPERMAALGFTYRGVGRGYGT
ncbi:MAG TPA: UDP-glucose/GDP-mannose dehydrogenase family protein [Anaerolineae bacterium]|nr:UDP-glucose/GDP-mannose dehydrogenase family protein [Anaerolineae bacterium]HOQ97382.1 UDP-glucose/GDP-mannose dehydrogenase family protein [Anaerolineae bacterium]HPL27341.1 UDP-glucose/GDP-mannose dehydrogenase family protein [Anaerolineae bacterium]